MNVDRKHLVTGALLVFVAVTGVTFAVKETRHARAVAASEVARAARPEPTPAEPIVTTPTIPADPPAMRVRPVPAAEKPASAATAAPRPVSSPATIVVTYFHATARCASCLKIEDLTNATMTTRFAGPIAEKRVVWRVVNVDEPENAHFVKDYGLFTKSVVVSEMKAGREVRWKNLEKVWKLLGEPEAFQGYVEQEVRAFLEKA